MDYGSLIGRAWHLTWRHPYLWLLGLFATSSVGSCAAAGGGGGRGVEWRASPEDLARLSRELESVLRENGFWPSRGPELLALVVVVGLSLALLFAVLSLIAQGGMARATAELAMGRAFPAGRAWVAGLRLSWRYLFLWLLLIAVGVLVALAVGGAVALGFRLAGQGGAPPRLVAFALAALGLLLAILVALPVFVALAVAVAFAQGAIAVEEVGPVAALREGLRLVRRHLGASFLLWLVNLGLSLVAGLAVALGVVALLVLLGVGAVVVFGIVGLSSEAILYSLAALVALILWAWFLGAITNTFFWCYWTLAYLHLTGRLTV